MKETWDLIYKYVKSKTWKLGNSLESSGTKAELAELRRGIGKMPGELPQLWGSFLLDLPEELEKDVRDRAKPTYAEWAIYTALTLYALHQQGRSETVNSDDGALRLGGAVKKLVHSPDDEERVMRRFSAMATSSEPAELANHLRSVVQLLKSENIKLDYADLAKDLYFYQMPNQRNNVRLKWGRDYYREENKDDIDKEGEK